MGTRKAKGWQSATKKTYLKFEQFLGFPPTPPDELTVMRRVWTAFKFDFEDSLRGDIFLGLVLGTLFLLAARANTTNVALAVLGETARNFFRAVTEVDSIVMLLAVFCSALLVATHEKRTRREKGHFRKYLFRAFLRFSADAVAVAFGATVIQGVFART